MLMLNTHLQRIRQAEYLTWEFYESGPRHQLTHTAVAKRTPSVFSTSDPF
jgi:hypothetical protein